MAVDNRSTSALFKRAEQLRRWQESETNKTDISNNKNRKVNFSDGCIFLAACAAGDKQEVIRLLEKGADIDTANVDGLTALHAACIDDNLDMVEFLVNQGADVNRGDMEGWTPLHATASCGFNSIAKFLIDRGADLSLVNNDGDLAIDIADSDEMESLLQREIDTRGIDCIASRNEEERMMVEDAQRWLGAGYLADRPHPKTGATALHVAAAKGYIKVMSLLLEAGSDINAQDLDGWTPLHAASHWCQRDAVEILSENMADMEKQNFVGQTAFDVADSSLVRLMDELKRKQAALKLVNQNKQTPRKRKTSPHRDHSNKKEREDQRESDGTSGDESSSDVEKKNKVNKEKTPQIIPTSPDKNNARTVPQAKGENAIDESEVQSWRRPSSLRKTQQDDKNQEVSRIISTPARVNNKEVEDLAAKRTNLQEKDESSLSATRERLKSRSCPVLSQLEEEEVRGGGGREGGGVWPQTRPHSRTEGIPSPNSSSSPLILYQRLSSSDLNIPSLQNQHDLIQLSSSSYSSPPTVTNNQLITSIAPLCTSLTYSPAKTTCIAKTSLTSPSPAVILAPAIGDTEPSTGGVTVPTTATTTVPSCMVQPTSPTTTDIPSLHKPLGSSMSTPVLSSSDIPSVTSLLPPSLPPSSTTIVTTSTTAGLASLSTNPSTNNKDPRLLARSASLRERIQRNHVDSMARVTPIPEPLVSTNSVLTTNTSPPVRSIGRSFVPPSRDEESETQRKAHAKMVRSTRRSTQGVTLEDIKSAEQLMKNKQQQATTSSPESKESSSAPTASSSIPQGATTTTTTTPKPTSSPTKTEEEERRPSWRLKVDDVDKTKFCLEDVRSKDKQEENEDSDTQTVTVQLRKKPTEEKGDEDLKDNERNSQTREGTQAAIQRRKKPKRRSTGRVQVNMDDIDPEKRAQRLAEQQLQQQQDDNRSDDGEEEDDSSVSEKGEVTKGSTSSLGSSAVNSRPSSRGSSIGPENGDLDYKKLYEEQLEENFRVHERLRGTENELRMSREAIDTNNKKNNTRLAMAEADKREKRALERKLSEMEEELKLLEQLKQENQRLKDENGALIRVISKLSK